MFHVTQMSEGRLRKTIRKSLSGAMMFAMPLWALADPVAVRADEKPATEPHVRSEIDATEVIVTARRRKEALQDVPLAISVVSGAELNAQHLDRVSDYGAKVPNFIAIQQNTRVSGMAIRGLGGNANNDGSESGVGLIVDNVFYTHVGFSWLDFVDLEGIEVVRGPQGTLLGKNTTVGAVIIKTRLPSFTPEVKGDLTVGSRNRTQFRFSATGPLVEDRLAYRLTVSRDIGGGWIENRYNGDRLLDNNRYALRGQLYFTPTGTVSSRLIVEQLESKEFNNFYAPQSDANFNYNPDGTVYTTTANPTGARPGSWTNRLKSVFGYTADFNLPDNAHLDTQGRAKSRAQGVSNEVNWEVGGLTLTAISAWRKLTFRPVNDSDYTPFNILGGGYDIDVNQYSQEFRLASPAGGPFDWQVGAFYLREDLSSNLHFLFYKDATAFFLTGQLPANLLLPAVLNDVDYAKHGKVGTKSSAVFGQGTWHITDRFDVTAGLRYTSEDKRVTVVGSATGGAPLTASLASARAAVLASFGGTSAALGGIYSIGDARTEDSLSWLINPSYKLTENVRLYASAAYGEKSGAANTAASPISASFTLPLLIAPEESQAYEAGVKSMWLNRRLLFNVNFYRNTLTNYQGARVVSTAVAVPYLGNVGEVRAQGIEVEARWRVSPDLSLSLSAAGNDARSIDYPSAPSPVDLAASTGPILSLSGEALPGVPKWNVQGSFEYARPVGRLELFTYGNAAWRSKVSLLNPKSSFGKQAAYALVNAGIGLRTADGRLSVVLWSKNLLDERYIHGFATASAINPYIAVPGDPRTLGITLSARY
ncbi:TonB-dependent receptor [Asticcacaulis sp. BYS171W]|uniref:TonB-dependent receptor n=1 Tax=Asticcacaulis aquaticus TaxID=2984212 RepID=A0ABT5I0G6_9CAUL|nr:TonB-dependent receptor [Asticcacaulis aquaticus]MDC7685176.1 TonB-dependent receptor [Asticcacaulis aquaticus]